MYLYFTINKTEGLNLTTHKPKRGAWLGRPLEASKDGVCVELGNKECMEELVLDKEMTTSVGNNSEYYLEHPIPVAPVAPPGQQIPPKKLLLLCIQPNITGKGHKEELKAMFSKQAEQELLQTVREFHTCKQEEGQSVSTHVLKMKGYIDNLERLGQPVGKNLADAICHECGEIGHWRRNCPVYLTELMKKKKLPQGASTSGIFTIELYSFPSKSWIYDTGCGTHICITTQGLRGSRKLKPGALSLYVGDGHRAAVEAIGTYHLELPSGLVIVLNNCHYAPSITRGVISVSRLFDDGFINRFDDNNVISVSKDNLVYFMAVPRDGIFEIDMSCSNTNDSSILLNSIDIESLGKCVSCLSGKMARKPYSHQVERPKDLLGLIHTDVCGPFRIVSRQGASYFVTFTDDFSRYGYVYLLKHKNEVFETFKVFQKEVENQLGKTIKSLRSDCGGEYMSQEFLDHLKEHGIIAHRTPPYTPQNNGVSKRKNRTLLDMVRSMMSQTTLPKSFWDYALETAARILNMVPSKKFDKTPYEIWHGQAVTPPNSLQRKTGFGIVTSWREEDLIREMDLYMPIYQCRLHTFRNIEHLRKHC
ncbi:retrotransposon protein, putative, ty1-copia subclass [Tanacetum coccineum]|uniref:Retrotransposon protein, putative, ty1-copia subclass n=1 Tax=Tanacetum coccineum TaxID=301880 RepID=A0ABQ5FVD2_9ASTR